MNRFLKHYEDTKVDDKQLQEAADPSGLHDLIIMQFYRMSNGPISHSDERRMLLLTAALGILSSSRDSRAINVARKLYQRAMN